MEGMGYTRNGNKRHPALLVLVALFAVGVLSLWGYLMTTPGAQVDITQRSIPGTNQVKGSADK